MRRARFLVPMLAALVLPVACTDDDTAAPTTTTTPASTVPPPTTASRPPSDGILTIGLLVPRATDSQLGQSLQGAADEARKDIEQAGGQIRLLRFNEEDSASDAVALINEMRDNNVDAIVGPASSTIAIETLDAIVEAGMVACSPTASSLLLDDFPDDNLFFRSIPSDSLQAQALAERATATGGRRVSFAYLDDMYGRGLFDATREHLDADLHEFGPQVPFSSGDQQFDDEVDRLLENDPEVIVVTADDDTGPEILAEIGRALERTQGGDGDGPASIPSIIVNDAMRRPTKPALIGNMPPEVRRNIVGVSPNATPPPDAGFGGPYSLNAYDCVTALALASVQANSDRSADIAGALPEVSSNGQKCESYQECADRLDLNIDYDGPSGLFELDEDTGDPTDARFDVFGFDEDGVDTTEAQVVVP